MVLSLINDEDLAVNTRNLLYSVAFGAVVTAFAAQAGAGELKPYQPTSHSIAQSQPSTGDMQTSPSGKVDMQELPEVAGQSDVVCCPDDGSEGDAAYRALPDEIRRHAKPGQCFAKLLVAPQLDTFNDRVLVTAERTETRTIPAVTQTVEKQVLVKPERVESRTIPAKTRWVEESVVDTAESYRETVIPARYETVKERVLVHPERQEWVASDGIRTGAALVTPIEHEPVAYRADGTLTWPGKQTVSVPVSRETAAYLQQGSAQTVYCLKETPAEYRTVEKRIEVEPARTQKTVIPATYKKVKRQVVDTPERVENYTIPAVYEKRKVTEVVTPARTETFTVPAVYKTVTNTRVVSEPKPVWREVLCEKNATPETVANIQRALIKRGYDVGAVDGRLGPKTVRAMQKFQADNGLPQGQVSLEAVELLGVKRP